MALRGLCSTRQVDVVTARMCIRMCIGCREREDRSVLLRVVAAEVGGVLSAVPDPDRRQPGRGASLHPRQHCLDLAERRRAFSRALRSGVPLASEPVREYLAGRA
ncbi:YlxR family protein [Spongisporangium articulatum]|uniref:YlxR family protein n=1 Tax=Spongisporangium articulatum TaxID=3362603 RepID=A0ABW8AMT3_9ACTN